MTDEIFKTLAMAFAFSLLGLSVYLACRVVRIIDFTCDASVSVGGCSYAAAVVYGAHPAVAALASMLLGGCMGFITASLSSNLRVKTSVTSVITFIMSQIFVFKMCSLGNASSANSIPETILGCSMGAICAGTGGIAIVICLMFHKITNSEYGLAMRIYREGSLVAESLGICRANMLAVGLILSNAVAALSGAFMVQISRTFYPTMGLGTFVFGLGAILLIEKMNPCMCFKKSIVACAMAAFFYRMIIDVVARCIGGTTSGVFSEYEHVVAGIALIMLIALTFSGKAPRKSVIHI